MTEKYIRLDDVMTIIARKHLFKDKTDFDKCVHAIAEQIKALDTIEAEPQEWISPTAEPVSVAEAKKLLYQEFKDKMKDGNPRLLVAYEIAMKALETQTERISVSVIEKIHDAIDNADSDGFLEDEHGYIIGSTLTKEHIHEIIDKAVKECTHDKG